MPLVANFERPSLEDKAARSEASLILAQAFEAVHRAVTIYESSFEPHEETVDSILNKARSFFGKAAGLFSDIEASSAAFRDSMVINMEFPSFELETGILDERLGRLSGSRFRRRIGSEQALIYAAVDVCKLSDAIVKHVGSTRDVEFESHFRIALIDLSQLHAFAVALSEVFARSVKG